MPVQLGPVTPAPSSMAPTAAVLTVLYATETGNAEDIAHRIAQIAYRHHVSVRLYNLADYDRVRTAASHQLALVDETHVVFVVSTTGHGEFPSPARAFWQFLLRKGLPDDILSDVTFTTFGLGDSVYTRFCWASRMLNRRLRDLGAVEWFERGEADEQHELGYVVPLTTASRADCSHGSIRSRAACETTSCPMGASRSQRTHCCRLAYTCPYPMRRSMCLRRRARHSSARSSGTSA